jgi:hypothetical protein
VARVQPPADGVETPSRPRQPAAALGTYGDSPTPPSTRVERRASNHQLKAHQRRLTSAVSSRLCWYAAATQVSIDVGAQLVAHVGGIRRCGSSWACPVCAPVIRERRAVEVDRGLQTHLERGGGALFVTLTLQHRRRDPLASRLDTISRSLDLVLKGSGWDRRRLRYGYLGAIKAVEITWGEDNGWHPHSHSVLLFERPLTEAEQADLEQWLFQRWSDLAKKKKLGKISRQHGVDLRAVTDGEGIGRYVTKVEGGWTAGHELARGDRKGNSPLQLLRNLVATGETKWARLWTEYEHATYGKRSLRWSPGLRAHLALDEDQADEQLAASEGVDLTLLRALVDAGDWNRVVRAGATADLLEQVEQGAALILGLWHVWGIDPQPLDLPGASP